MINTHHYSGTCASCGGQLMDDFVFCPYCGQFAKDDGHNKPEPCEWAADEDGIWHSKCGSTWILTDGGPAENKMEFCLKCGKKIVVKELEEEVDD